jgi:hypothetical protein
MPNIDSKHATGATGVTSNISPTGTAAPGVRRIVSGDVPRDPAENVSYVVVNSRDKQVVATFMLPGHAANVQKFSILVTVPSTTDAYEAGRLDEHGKFVPANFTISETSPITGPMKAGETRHGA